MQKQKRTNLVYTETMCNFSKSRAVLSAKMLVRSLLLLAFLLSHQLAFSQIIWQEDFNGYPDGTTSGAGWAAGPAGQCDGNIGQWGIYGGQFNGNDIEGFNCCPCAGGPPNNCGDNQNAITFGPFDISNYCDVSLNFTFGASGSMECNTGCGSPPPFGCVGNGHDQAVFTYSLDGGLPVEFGYYCGNNLCSGGPSFFGLNGSTISFTITMGNQAVSENYFFDDMLLQGNLRPTPVPTYNAPLCVGQTLNLMETGGAGTSWNWSGPGFSSTLQNPSIPGVNLSNAGTYSVTVTNGGSCTGVQTVDVIINNGPMISLGPDQSACQGDPPIILDAGPGYTNYLWSPSGSGQTVTIGTGAPLPTTQYSVTVTDPGGCTAESSVFVTVNATPDITNPGNQSACDQYILPPINGTNLSGSQGYFTGPGGTGTNLPVGSAVSNNTSLFIYDINGACFDEESFSITINPSPMINNPGNQQACGSVVLPPITGTNLSGSEAYFDAPGGMGTSYFPGMSITSTTVLFIYDINGTCPGEVSFSVTIDQTPDITPPGDQNACDSYLLPPITGTNLSGNESYYDGPGGTGTVYLPGQLITTTTVLFIYDANGICTDEESFTVTINPSPDITPMTNQEACDSYLLPAISGTNLSGSESYYDSPGGGGTPYSPGTLITTTTTLFIYDAIGNCSDEEFFQVTINPTPNLSNPGNQMVCGSYLLPAISGTNLSGNEAYYDSPGGTGTTYLPGTVINTTTTIFIYDAIGSCSDEEFFQVTITASPELNNPGDQIVCDEYMLPAITGTNLSGNEGYFDGPGGTGTQYLPGDLITATTVLYLYDASGSCTDEETFAITVNVGPTLTNPGNQNVCDQYILPAISGSNLSGNESYWSATGGTGTQYAPGTAISSNSTIYIYDANGSCTDEESFTITITPAPTITNPGNQSICDSYILPVISGNNLSGNEAYWSAAGGTGTQYAPGAVINSTTTLFIYDAAGSCTDEESFTITITPAPTITNPGNQSICDSYILPVISGNNLSGNEAYWSAAGGTGTQYAPGAVINSTTTLFIYDAAGSCTDEESFTITITPAPTITNPGNQSICDSYILPVISGNNLSGNEAYWSAAGGTGTQYAPGAVINSTTTLFIYDAAGSCTDEESFTITITPAPTITNPGNQSICDSYILPVISGNNLSGNEAYWSAAGGTGTQYAPGAVINSTTTLFIYDAAGSCTDEESFTITITPAPTITNPGNQSICDSYILPVISGNNLSGNEAYWSAAGGTGTQYAPGAVINSTTTLFIYDAAGSCTDEESFTITITPAPTITNPGNQSICDSYILPVISGNNLSGNEAYWSAAGGTGTQYAPGAVINSTTTLFIYDGSGNCSDEESFIITITPSPSLDAVANEIACDSYTLPAINGSNLSGNEAYYSASGGLGTQYLPGAAINSSTTLFLYDSQGNCNDETSFSITISSSPEAGMNNTVTVCEGSVLDLTTALQGADAGGSFSDDSATGALSGANFNTSGLAGSTYQFTYTLTATAPCTDDQAVINVTVATAVTAGSDITEAACEGTSLNLFNVLSGADLGGSFTDDDGSGGLTGGMLNTTGLSGTYQFTYTVGDGVVCPIDQSVVSITVQPAPQINPAGNASACDNYVLPAISGNNLTSSVAYYSAPNGGGNSFLPGQAISSSMTLYIYDNNGGCEDETSFSITITPSPVINPMAVVNECGSYTLPVISGNNLSGNEAYYDASNGGGTRYLPGQAINSSITLYLYDANGVCSDEETLQINITAAPVLAMLANQDVCESYTLPAISGTNLSGNEAYYDAANGGGNSFLPGQMITSSMTLFIFDQNGTNCQDETSFTITVNDQPDAGMDNLVSVCQGSQLDLTTALMGADPGGTFVDLDVSGGLSGSQFNTNGVAVGTYRFNYLLTATAPCQDAQAQITVEIVTSVTAGLDNSGNLCEGTTVDLFTLLDGADLGGNFTDNDGSGGLSTNLLNTTGLNGTFTFTYTVGDGVICPVDQSLISVNISASPQLDQPQDQEACGSYTLGAITGNNLSGNEAYYDASNGGGTQYLPGTILTASTPLFIYDNNGLCDDEQSFTLTIVNPVSAGDDNTVSVCEGATLDLNTALMNADAGGSFADLSSTGMLSGSNFNTSGLPIGSYNFAYQLTGTQPCPDDQAMITVNVVNAVTAGMPNSTIVCEGQMVDLVTLLNGGDLGGTFSDDDGSGALNSDQFNSTGLAGNTFNFTYTVGDGVICPVDQATLQVSVIAAPQLDPVMDAEACDIYTLPAISGTSTGAAYYLSPNGAGAALSAGQALSSSATVYIFEDNGTCTAETSFDLTIINSPDIDQPTAITDCGSITLPAITGSNLSGNEAYFTMPGGNGTSFQAGDPITNSTTLYLYDSNNSCDDEEQLVITITPGPSIAPQMDVTDCESYTLPAISGNDLSGNEAYFTMPGGNGTSFQAGEMITSSTTLYLYDNNGGCEAETSFDITINTAPGAGTDNTVSACTGSMLDLSTALNGADPGGVFLDNNSTGALSGNIFNTASTGSGTFQFDYLITGTPPCPDARVTITVNVVNAVSAGPGNQLTVCAGTTVNLFSELMGGDLGGTFSDDNSSGGLSNGSLNTTGLNGSYNFTYTIGDGVICPVDQSVITVDVTPAPALDPIMDIEICDSYTLPAINGSSLSSNVAYFDQPNGNGISYLPGDQITSSLRLYAFDQNGNCQDETSFSITINDAPTINNLNIICDNTTNEFVIIFSISDGDPATYVVTGNTGTLTGNQFTSDPLPSGSAYNFSVNDGNNCGTATLSNVHNCSCTGTDAGSLSPASQRVCESGSSVITSSNTSTNPDDLLIFILHDGNANTIGTILATNTTPQFSFFNGLNFGQSYFVAAIAGTNDGNGGVLPTDPCLSVSEGVEIIFDPEITASINGDATLCGGDTTILTFSLSGGATFDVTYSANGATQNLTGITDGFQLEVTPGSTTVYNLTDVVVAGSACSFVQPSNAVTVTVSDLNVQASVDSNFGGFGTSCADSQDGEASATAIDGIAPYDFIWSTGDTAGTIDGLGAGIYSVTITDAAGCTSLSTVSLSSPQAISLTTDAQQPSCLESSDGSIIIDNIMGGAVPLEYSLNGQLFNPIDSLPLTISGVPSGSYNLVIQDVNDCMVTESVLVPQATVLVAELGDDVEVPLGDSARIRANFNFVPDTIFWISAIPLSCDDCDNPFVRPIEATTITIIAIDENGCSATDQITVNVIRNRKVYIPNTFTPNGDGINDFFEIYGGDNVAKINSFQIFDRWGEVVFRYADFNIGDPKGAWDGYLRGKKMNSAVFVYYAEVEFVDGSVRRFKGDVTLAR